MSQKKYKSHPNKPPRVIPGTHIAIHKFNIIIVPIVQALLGIGLARSTDVNYPKFF